MSSRGTGVVQLGATTPPAKRACKLCGRASWLRSNPYYGAGLAVHEWMYVCAQCGWMEMVAVEAPAVMGPDERGAVPSPLRRWLSSIARRRVPSGSTRG